jgi:hypothetical protein
LTPLIGTAGRKAPSREKQTRSSRKLARPRRLPHWTEIMSRDSSRLVARKSSTNCCTLTSMVRPGSM